MDNDTIVKLVTLVLTALTTMFGAWIAYKTKQVERVQAKMEKKQVELEKTSVETHKLVNYQSLVLARQHEVTARALAKVTGLPEDITQAETAARLRIEAEAKQESLCK